MLTSFVRTMIDRARFRAKMLRLAMTVRPIAGADGDPSPEPSPDPPAKTFSQDDVDRIVRDRLDRAARGRISDDDLAALQAKAKRLDALEAENRSEIDKMLKRAEDAEAATAAAIAERDAAVAQSHETLRRSAIVTAAAEAGADPEVVYALLHTRGFKVADGDNSFEVTVGDDGHVTGVEDSVKALLAQKNVGVVPTPTGPGDGGARTPVPKKDLSDQIREAEEKGDINASLSLKTQKLAGIMADRR